MPLFHPSDIQLRRFASQQPDAASLHRHLENCARCRKLIADERELSARARALPDLDAGDDILGRIVESRRADTRVILPTEDEPPRPNRRLVRVLAAAAAIILLVVFASPGIRRVKYAPATDDEVSGIRSLLGSVDLSPATVEAHGLGQLSAVALRGRALAPMTLRFERHRLTSSGKILGGSGNLLLRIGRSPAPDSAWIIDASWTNLPGGQDQQSARTQTEGVRLTRDLRPVLRVVEVTPYRRWAGINIRQEFSGDSVLGRMMLRGTTTVRPIARSLAASRNRLVPSDALGPVYLMGVRLFKGWTAEIDFLGWAVVPNDVTYPATLAVVGSERVTVPAGTFDCWKMSVSIFGRTHYQWVRKSDNVGIRVRHDAADGKEAREEVLLSER